MFSLTLTGSLGPGFAPPEAANQNAVPATWLSYDSIRCVTPPWDLHTDDDLSHGGKQVTVFVTNDGVRYSAGYDETWDPHSGSLPGVELAVSVHLNSRKTLTGDYYNDVSCFVVNRLAGVRFPI